MQNTSMYGSTPGAGTAGSTTEELKTKASEKLTQFTDAAQQTVDRVTQAASEAASRISQRGEELWQMRDQATETARTYMREHPVATIGIAIAIGLILSRLLTRR